MLPLGFTELEYLESTGTQYIDTGIVPDTNTGLRIRYSISNTNQDIAAIGVRENTSTLSRYYVGYYMRRFQYGWNSYKLGTSDIKIQDNEARTYILNFKNNKIGTVEGTAVSYEITETLATQINTLKIPVYHNATNLSVRPAKIYFMQISQNTTVVMNLIPALRNSDGEIGMFDTVTGTLLTNQGTGKFVAGPKVLVSSGKEVVMKGNIEVPSFKSLVVKKLLPEGYEISSSYKQIIKL